MSLDQPPSLDPSVDGLTLAQQIDQLSLTQALLDFEVANARVLDLTARVVDAGNASIRMQAEADAARAETAEFRVAHASTRHELEMAALRAAAAEARVREIESSRSYRAARMLARVRRLLRR